MIYKRSDQMIYWSLQALEIYESMALLQSLLKSMEKMHIDFSGC